ncbi:MAG: Gfo/Idh/MocA family oxidoreductase [Verrucomicrobia bacterium]|nr:Gfo/Idh/MocA family oxidoreductase [Verrucomicrobiota bacterium]
MIAIKSTTALAPISRRAFLRYATLAASCPLTSGFLPRALGAGSANERLNLAFIGVGGRGRDNLNGLRGENVVALCDVDEARAAQSLRDFPNAKVFRDFRVMLDQLGRELDGVVVSTPDHTHAPAVIRAIGLGKHVYCEKPLAHSLHEIRTITQAARAKGIATQLGNQGHSSESIRQFVEMIHSCARSTPGAATPTDRAPTRSDPPTPPPPRPPSIGISGSARPPPDPITPSISRANGAAGSTSAPASSATGSVTSWIRSSGR